MVVRFTSLSMSPELVTIIRFAGVILNHGEAYSYVVCQWLAATGGFLPRTFVSFTKKTDCHDLEDIQ